MCGRYTLIQIEKLKKRFLTENDFEELPPNFNVAPGSAMPVITRNSPNKIEIMKWGLVPLWAKDIQVGYKMINARAETVAEKPSFRTSLKSRRCLVPVSGYYEWKKEGSQKQPYYYMLPKNELFAFAGLTAQWHDSAGNELQTYTIITTAANSLAAQVHDRMPVILKKEDENVWLDPMTPMAHIESLLKPYDSQEMETFPVSSDVNTPHNNSSSLIVANQEKSKVQGSINSA